MLSDLSSFSTWSFLPSMVILSIRIPLLRTVIGFFNITAIRGLVGFGCIKLCFAEKPGPHITVLCRPKASLALLRNAHEILAGIAGGDVARVLFAGLYRAAPLVVSPKVP